MKKFNKSFGVRNLFSILSLICAANASADPATLLFEDNFTGGIPGWTAVQPAGGTYIDGPMLWEYDKVSDAFSEQSNIYTDAAAFSGSRIAVMLINSTVAPTNFTYTARLTAGDDDAFGLIWGYQDENTFYRVTFARQNRAATGWPYQGWIVDRMNNGQFTTLFGPSNPFLNTVTRPFDVTITVTNGLLNLSVIDDPLGTPTPYTLVTDGALPTVPSAKVGMFSWGQSGNNPRAFRIQNPVLSPTPLTGDPASTVLTNWSFLITPRGSDGTVPVIANTPIWAQGLSINGDRGTMIENSDWTADNTAAFTTNFAAPSAIAGNVNWTNYVYTARIISSDNDGFGVLLRYKDEMNFYRIAFRNQASQSGIKQGISIQKNVNLAFEQIFASTNFVPPNAGIPIDVSAFIRSNRLQIIIISNPLSSAAQSYFFGPFDITGNTVDNGKIGVFSWAQNTEATQTTSDAGTEVDFVKVQEVNGEGLIVSSAYGTPTPAVGLNDLPIGTIVTATNNDVVMSLPGVRRVSTGWSGVGSVPPSGATNQVTFTLSTFSSLTWKWRTDYLLTTSATAGGSVNATLGPWIAEGTNVTVTATPSPGFIFLGWSGDSISSLANLTFAMTRPITLTANFTADSDGDGLADSWENQYFGNLSQNAAGDPDSDQVSNLNEYQRNTNPNVAEAVIVSDGLSSPWLNVQRDPALPGQFRVVDFGSGYRGVFDDSNDNRSGNDFTFIASTNYADYGSWQSPRMIVRSNVWNQSWATNFSANWELSVGDNDGTAFYFRYKDEKNWYRVAVTGEDPIGAVARPALGLSVQRRLNGNYINMPLTFVSGPLYAAYTDPTDGAGTPAGFKKVRITVNATNENFEVRVIGWNAFAATPDFDPAYELIHTFTDTNHLSGSIGFGFWGMGGFGNNLNETNGIPIPIGGFVDNIVVKAPADGAVVFSETWETTPLVTELPTGWTNPYANVVFLAGDWRRSAHGTLAQQSDSGTATTGTALSPKADADGPILLAPDPMTANYYLQIGFHPFDNDGIGFVYDYLDENNYSRVLFVAEATSNTRMPQGLNVSSKVNGVWSDVAAGDNAFVYTPGRPFEIEFANNNGFYRLLARDLDNPTNVVKWQWAGTSSGVPSRFGMATWSSTDAHLLYARAYSLAAEIPPSLTITSVSISGGNIVMNISRQNVTSYTVERTRALGDAWVPVAINQTGSTYSEPVSSEPGFYRLKAQ